MKKTPLALSLAAAAMLLTGCSEYLCLAPPGTTASSKLTICHKTGKAGKFELLTIKASAAEAHIKHGDFLAPAGAKKASDCVEPTTPPTDTVIVVPPVVVDTVVVVPPVIVDPGVVIPPIVIPPVVIDTVVVVPPIVVDPTPNPGSGTSTGGGSGSEEEEEEGGSTGGSTGGTGGSGGTGGEIVPGGPVIVVPPLDCLLTPFDPECQP